MVNIETQVVPVRNPSNRLRGSGAEPKIPRGAGQIPRPSDQHGDNTDYLDLMWTNRLSEPGLTIDSNISD